MPSDDELRRVAEDVRALARSLGRDIRAALDRAREDMYGPRPDGEGPQIPHRLSAREDLAVARRVARHELRQAQLAVRQAARSHYHYRHGHPEAVPDGSSDDVDNDELLRGPGPRVGSAPRWDNWGGRGYGQPTGRRPGGRGGLDRRGGPRPPRGGHRGRTPSVPTPPLRHRHDGSTLLGLLAVVFGLAWLAAGTHLAHVSTEAVVAIALMVLGVATVVTARTDWALSRRSWPLVGGAALAVTLLALSASPNLPVGFRHLEFGSRTVAPATWTQLPGTIHGGFGRTVIDLTSLPEPLAGPRTLVVDNAAGRLEINIPVALKVNLAARISAGQIDVNGVATSGVRRFDYETLNPTATGPALTVQVEAGLGSLAITTVTPATPRGLGRFAGTEPGTPSPPITPPTPTPPGTP